MIRHAKNGFLVYLVVIMSTIISAACMHPCPVNGLMNNAKILLQVPKFYVKTFPQVIINLVAPNLLQILVPSMTNSKNAMLK